MKYNKLGRTGIEVSELCFGILPMGPLQANISAEEGGRLILSAMEQGINFFDSAQMYGSYAHLRYALDRYDGDVIITGKSVAADHEGMAKAIDEGLEALGRDHFDIFLLHAARMGKDILTLRQGAWECLKEYKAKGLIRAIGVSTHNVEAVAELTWEPDVDVIFALYNIAGLGLLGGTPEDMLEACCGAAAAGKGVYSMKLLAGGNLLSRLKEAVDFGRKEKCFASHAIGMIYPDELSLDLALFNDEPIDGSLLAAAAKDKQWQLMAAVCKGCGKCIENCHSDALEMKQGKPSLIRDKCLLCGYCAAECPEFAIRVR